MVQYLSSHTTRTEYRILQLLTEVKLVDYDNLETGNLLIPGIVLKNISGENIKKIKSWTSTRSNHLILTPAWPDLDIGKVLSLKSQVKINDHCISTSVKNAFIKEKDTIKGIRFRNNTSSCLITLTTLPVLDYRSILTQEQRSEYWKTIISEDSNRDKEITRKTETKDSLNAEDKMVLLLYGAQISLIHEPKKIIKKYFGENIANVNLENSMNKLQRIGLINKTSLTSEGEKIIQDQNLASFLDALINRKESSNGWDL